MDDIPQPGSLEAEAGVFCSTFDMTGTRLITGGADKTIKASLSCFFSYVILFLSSWLTLEFLPGTFHLGLRGAAMIGSYAKIVLHALYCTAQTVPVSTLDGCDYLV